MMSFLERVFAPRAVSFFVSEHNSPLSLLFCFVVIQLPLVFFPAVLLFVESEGVIDDLYYRSNVVTGSVGDDKLTKAEQDERLYKPAGSGQPYQVTGVSVRQEGETRIITWNRATGPLPVIQYNIYRTFATGLPFDISKLDPIAILSSVKPHRWTDDCRTEGVSVQYTVTAVDIAGNEHSSNLLPSKVLPLMGSFAASSSIKYPVLAFNQCSVLHHDIIYNPHLYEFVLVYDCDYNGDGSGDDVFVARLDSSGNNIHQPMSIKISETISGFSVQEHPSIAYNPKRRECLVAFHARSKDIHHNRTVIMTRVVHVQSGKMKIVLVGNPRLSARAYTSRKEPTDLIQSSLIYNPLHYGYYGGYVIAAELNDVLRTEIVAVYLPPNGRMQTSAPVFSFSVSVHQPNVIFDPGVSQIVFVSQLHNSLEDLPAGRHALLIRSENAKRPSNSGLRSSVVVSYTSVHQSSISLTIDSKATCLRICYINKNIRGLKELRCIKPCNVHYDSNQATVTTPGVSSCSCERNLSSSSVIYYPANGAMFGVWEESHQTDHFLHGYYINAENFVQTPAATSQKHPVSTYRSTDGQVCVAWQYLSTSSAYTQLAFRCFRLSPFCNDPCCCLHGRLCDPCAPGYHNCKGNEECKVNGTSATCVCKPGYIKKNGSCLIIDFCDCK